MILGLDFDTRAVHAVLLDDDSNAARYVPVPFVEHKPPFEFDDARNVRAALNKAIRRPVVDRHVEGRGLDGWESIWLVGIEKPYSQNKDSSWKYGLVVGQILSCIPRAVPVLDIAPQEWKRETVGKPSAGKYAVARWAKDELIEVDVDLTGWPQDAYDAYSIARAARSLNERAIGSAA